MSDSAKKNNLWFTRLDSAALIGIGDRQFDAAVRPLLPPHATQGEKRTLRFYGPDVVATRLKSETDQLQRRLVGDDDVLLIGDDGCPELRRYRRVKADLLQLELDKQTGTHVDRHEILAELLRFSGIIRSATDQVRREFGNAPADIIQDAIHEAQDGWRKILAAPEPQGAPQ